MQLAFAPSSAAKPAGDRGAAVSLGSADNPCAEMTSLADLRSRLECKSSLPLVAEFLQNLSIFEEWRRTRKKDAMLKVATKFGAPRKKDGQLRKVKDVAEDLEALMLSRGRTMLRDSAEKPATTLEELQAWLATYTEETFIDAPPLKRLKTAVDILTLPPSDKRRTGVQKLCGPREWNVKQKIGCVKRNAQELYAALVAEVVTEGCTLRGKKRSHSSSLESTAVPSDIGKPSQDLPRLLPTMCTDALAGKAMGTATNDS